MSIFHRKKVQFSSHDPLDNGLGDDIAAEQHEPESFVTLDDISGDELSQQWASIIKDAKKDPDWFSFSND
jgi:hypothetical protein